MRLPGRSSSDRDHSIGLPAVAFRVDVYSGLERVKMLGPFSTEHDALVWCHEAGIEVNHSPRSAAARSHSLEPAENLNCARPSFRPLAERRLDPLPSPYARRRSLRYRDGR